MSKAPSNTAPSQQIAPSLAKTSDYLSKIQQDNKILHRYLQQAVKSEVKAPVQSSPQVDIPAFRDKGDQTVITSQNMGELQKISSLRDFLSPEGSRYQETLQNINGFRKCRGAALAFQSGGIFCRSNGCSSNGTIKNSY
jgi:hypothetical protein